jgi:hypothetical protein
MAKATSTAETLTVRQLGRATLARQLLLERAAITPVKAIEALVAIQAQLARPPYIALWTRLAGFRREALTAAITKRQLVRATLLRGTLHLLAAKDYAALRPLFQPMLDAGITGVLKERASGLDVAGLVGDVRAFLGDGARTFEDIRDHLVALRPGSDERAMGYAVRLSLPLVQVPEAGCDWGYPGTSAFAVAERWLGAPIAGGADAAALVVRYLAAFGPATAADAQRWSGLADLRPAFEALRPKLRTFRDERGRELFDLPGAPRPDADTPAPVRFLPDFDNLVLGHDDRRRVIDDEHRKAIATANLQIKPTFLVDGRVAGSWKITATAKLATLALTPFVAIAKAARRDLEAEGETLLGFVEPGVARRAITFADRT